MSRLAIAHRALFDLRWQIFWYGIGLALYGAAMIWIYPLFEDALVGFEQFPEEFLAFFGGAGDLAHPAVYITSQYQSFAPLVLIIYAVVVSTGQLAGDEGRGTLEVVLAEPVARIGLATQRALAFLLGAVLICAVISVGWLASVPFVDLRDQLTTGEMVAATFWMLPVTTFFAALGYLLGAIAPSRGMAAGILAALAIASYLVASLALAVEAIEWMQYFSPYYYSDASIVLTEGVVWWHQALLAGAALVLFALALLAFQRREIAVGTWQVRALAPRGSTA